MKTRRAEAPGEEKRDTRIHWVLADHLCRACGGRILLSVANVGMSPGGNAIYRCADCGKQSSGMHGPSDVCWCGQGMKGEHHPRTYMCLPFRVLEEKPWLMTAFRAFGCDPSKGDVGIMTRAEYDRLNEQAKSFQTGARVVFEFEDRAAADRFLGWFTGGFAHSGESSYLKAERSIDVGKDVKPVLKLDYTGTFETWGYKADVHGPDRIIRAPGNPGKAP